MTTAEWIIMVILAVTLFVFLIVAIVLGIKLIGLSKEIKKFTIKGQNIADKTGDVVDNVGDVVADAGGVVNNVKDLTSFGTLVKNFVRNQERKARSRKEDDEEIPRRVGGAALAQERIERRLESRAQPDHQRQTQDQLERLAERRGRRLKADIAPVEPVGEQHGR